MTNQEKIEAFSMRVEGKTLQEIADHYGITKQAVHQSLAPYACMGGNRKKISEIIYPNLRAWMNENNISVTKLIDLAHVGYTSISKVSRVYEMFRGDKALPLGLARKIAMTVGMTLDECFTLEEGKSEAIIRRYRKEEGETK